MPTPPYNTVLGIRGHHSSGLFLNATFEHFRATNKTHRQFLKADLESIFTVRFQELGQRTHSVWQYVRYPECFQKLPLSNVPHADEAGWCCAAIRFIYLYRWLNDSTPGTRTPPRPQQSLPRPLCPSVAWDPSPSPALYHSRNRRCTWSKVCCLKSVFSSLLTEKKHRTPPACVVHLGRWKRTSTGIHGVSLAFSISHSTTHGTISRALLWDNWFMVDG